MYANEENIMNGVNHGFELEGSLKKWPLKHELQNSKTLTKANQTPYNNILP